MQQKKQTAKISKSRIAMDSKVLW